jgi:hypothetical protein
MNQEKTAVPTLLFLAKILLSLSRIILVSYLFCIKVIS